MSNRLYDSQICREKCEKILDSFSIKHFFNPQPTGSEYAELKNFSEERFAIENLLRLSTRAALTSQGSYLCLTANDLIELKDVSEQLLSILQKMRVFHESSVPPSKIVVETGQAVDETAKQLKEEKESLTGIFFSLYDRFCEVLNKLVLWTTPVEIQQNVEKIGKIESGLQTQINTLNTRLDTQNTISPHAQTFEDYAKHHWRASWAWLLIGLAILAAVAYYSHTYVYAEIDTAIKNISQAKKQNGGGTTLFWGLLLIRLLTLGIAGSLGFWSLHNYKINKHNELLNRIKAAALRTFKDFDETTGKTGKTHDIVIKKIADAIFDTSRLGYLTDKSHDQDALFNRASDTILQMSGKNQK